MNGDPGISSWLRPMLAGGSRLSDWIRQGGRPNRAPAAQIWLYRWRGFWFDKGIQLLEAAATPKPEAFPDGEGMLFIMGFWRSGTTLLHETLAGVPGWGAPMTWQCMDPLLALKGAKPLDAHAIVRPMDAVTISPTSPQEDEFALMGMGVPSACLGFLDPRRMPSLYPLFEQDYWLSATPGTWSRSLRMFLEACCQEGCRHLAIKSPPHAFRYRGLRKHFPRARFVWILREPDDLWISNLKMWKAMTDRYGLWEAPPGGLEAFLEHALTAFARTLEELQTEGVFQRDPVIGYEALAQRPEETLAYLASRLGIPEADEWLRASAARVRPPASSAVPLPSSPPWLEALGSLQSRILASQDQTG